MTEELQFETELNILAAEISGGIDKHLQSKEEENWDTRQTVDWNWASRVHHPCRRSLVYQRLDYGKRRPIDLWGLHRVRWGRIVEADTRDILAKAGYRLERGQMELKWEKYRLKGKLDGAAPKGRRVYPTEIKSINPCFWNQTRTIEEIKRHPKHWINGIPSQLNAYLLMGGDPGGLLILCTFGVKIRILPMPIDYGLGEIDIQTCEVVNEYADKGIYPDRIAYEPSVCDLCDYNHLCLPIKSSTIIDLSTVTEEQVSDLNRFVDLEEAASERERLKKKLIGDAVKPGPFRGINALVGGIEITSSVYIKKMPIISEVEKAQFPVEETEVVRTSIKRAEVTEVE